ncbi:MAG: hypothetical protein ACYS18_02485 [Planctomycetota bacterium]|jgi:hypothetical protein
MFTIDLLKGRCVPVKKGPEAILITLAAFVVPIVVAVTMFGFYLSNRVVISVQKNGITKYEEKISELSYALELAASFEREKQAINSYLSEVSSSIGRHAQWSPILVTVVENMPDSMILTKIGVKQTSVKRKLPRKDDPTKLMDASVPVRTLQMTLSGKPNVNCDMAVKDFRDHLRDSETLGPNIEDIRVSQKADLLGGQAVVSYNVDCVFKPEL